MMVIDGLDLCVCTGDLPNDFEVETIIGKCFLWQQRGGVAGKVDGMWTM